MNRKTRKIIHIDMDCFYAAIEMRDQPHYLNKALAVGGKPEGRGVIATCNYKARKFGVHSALSSREAVRRCPDLIIVPPRFQLYKQESQKIRDIFLRYTKIIEPLSLDEAFLDVSDCEQLNGSATLIAQSIRQSIFEELNLTASAGIAPNKFLAKIASDWKKPNGQFTIKPNDIDEFIKSLPIEKIHGVGKATQKKMHSLNIYTCLDLQNKDLAFLMRHFGTWGERLSELCRGIDERSVKVSRVRKSLSTETTFNKDLDSWEKVEQKMDRIYEEFVYRWKKSNLSGDQVKSLQVKIKYDNFESMTRETQISDLPTFEFCLSFLQKAYYENSRPIRLIGLGVKLKVSETKKQRDQLPLF